MNSPCVGVAVASVQVRVKLYSGRTLFCEVPPGASTESRTPYPTVMVGQAFLTRQGGRLAALPKERKTYLMPRPFVKMDAPTGSLVSARLKDMRSKRGKGQKGQMGKRGNGEMGNGIRISGFGFSCLPRIPSPLPIFTFPLFPLLITYVRTRSSRNSRQPTQHLRRPGGAAGGENRRHPVWRALWQTNAHEEVQIREKRTT